MLSALLPVTLVAFAGNIILGFFTYSKNPRSYTNRSFFLFTIAIAMYLIANYLTLIQSNDYMTLFWIRATMSSALIINLLFFLFVSGFPESKLTLAKKYLWPAIIFTIVMLPLAFTGFIFKSIVPSTNQPVANFGMVFFLAHTVVLLGGGGYVLVRKFLKASGVERVQVKLLLLGTILMFLAIITTNLLFVIILNSTAFVGLLPVYTLVFVSFISYAIVKHGFFDISLIVARTVSFTLLIVILGVAYSVLYALITTLVLGASQSLEKILMSAFLALFMAATFQPIRRFTEKVTDKFFYKNRYDEKELLYSLTLIMASTFRLDELSKRFLAELLRQMRIQKGMLALIGKNKEVVVVAHSNFQNASAVNGSLLAPVLTENGILLSDELAEDSAKAVMKALGVKLATCLRTEGSNVGILLLGEKLSGDIYTPEDVRVLQIVAPEVAIAVQNAQSFEAVSKFNVTLREKVERATADLQKANTRLRDLDQLKDDFVSMASHELRTPMTAIRSYTWMALNRADVPLSEKIKKYLARTLISTERLINLVNDMLNISRIESGRVEIKPAVFDVQTLVADVLMEVAAKAKEKNLNLKIVHAGVPQVFADSDKVHQVLLNLLGNAMKFTPENGAITVSLFSDGNFVETSIKDTGVGILPEDLQRLFKKFGRLDNSYVAAATAGGTGLGLYISKSLINLMGGMIRGSSEGKGKGSVFTFSLPAATAKNMAESAKYTRKVQGEAKPLEPAAI